MTRRLSIGSLMLGALLLALPALPASAQTTRERGIGPYQLKTKRGEITVRLLRRDRTMVWVDQQTSTGHFVETGVSPAEIVTFEMPRPPILDVADRATTPEQIAQAQVALQRISDTLRPYRDLPGMPVDEALYLQALLLERSERWPAALAIYEDIVKQAHQPKEAAQATFRGALCHAKLGHYDEVLALVGGAAIPDDDLALQSELYFARAQALAAKGQHQEAIMDLLFLVVFNPFVQNNEVRCLSAVLPSYAAMEQWDAMWKTLAVLRSQYPDTPETKQAELFAKTYEKQLAAETEYQDPAAKDEESAP